MLVGVYLSSLLRVYVMNIITEIIRLLGIEYFYIKTILENIPGLSNLIPLNCVILHLGFPGGSKILGQRLVFCLILYMKNIIFSLTNWIKNIYIHLVILFYILKFHGPCHGSLVFILKTLCLTLCINCIFTSGINLVLQ